MDEAEFDKFADEYHAIHARATRMSGEGPEYFSEYKIRDIAREFGTGDGAVPPAPAILDFGSGSGGSVPFFRKHFPRAQLTCLDVSRRSLALAEERFPDMAHYMPFDGRRVQFPDGSFDIAFAACVFHHIDHAEHRALIGELRRVLRPGGLLVIYEHNPYNPLTVRVVNQCPFDANARLIRASAMRECFLQAGFSEAAIRYRVFFPRALAAIRRFERFLFWLPLGGQYYVAARR